MPNPIINRIIRNKRYEFIIATDADHTASFDPSWTFSDSSLMTVNWGDGTAIESHATALTHTYAGVGRKYVKFTCPDWTKLTAFDINTDECRFSLPSFGAFTGLLTFNAHVNLFAGVLPSFSKCTVMTYCRVRNNSFSSDIPSFAACTLLTTISFGTNAFSGYVAGCFATQASLSTLNLGTNSLPVASIDAILADLVTSLGLGGRVVCAVTLDGVGNAAPSNPAGLASKAALVAAWGAGNVTTN